MSALTGIEIYLFGIAIVLFFLLLILEKKFIRNAGNVSYRLILLFF